MSIHGVNARQLQIISILKEARYRAGGGIQRRDPCYYSVGKG